MGFINNMDSQFSFIKSSSFSADILVCIAVLTKRIY